MAYRKITADALSYETAVSGETNVWAGIKYEKNASLLILTPDLTLKEFINGSEYEVIIRAVFNSSSGFEYSTEPLEYDAEEENFKAFIPYEITKFGGTALVHLTVSEIEDETEITVAKSEPVRLYFTDIERGDMAEEEETETVSLALKICREATERISEDKTAVENMTAQNENYSEICAEAENTAVSAAENAAASKEICLSSASLVQECSEDARQSSEEALEYKESALYSAGAAESAKTTAVEAKNSAIAAEYNAVAAKEEAEECLEEIREMNIPERTSELINDGDNDGNYFSTDVDGTEFINVHKDSSGFYYNDKVTFTAEDREVTLAFGQSETLLSEDLPFAGNLRIRLHMTAENDCGVYIRMGETVYALAETVRSADIDELIITQSAPLHIELYAVSQIGPDTNTVAFQNISAVLSKPVRTVFFTPEKDAKLNTAASEEFVRSYTPKWRKIVTLTTDTPVATYTVNSDFEGRSFNLGEYYLQFMMPSVVANKTFDIKADGGNYIFYGNTGANGKNLYMKGEKCVNGWISEVAGFTYNDLFSGGTAWMTNYSASSVASVTKFTFHINGEIPAGTKINIYGKDA